MIFHQFPLLFPRNSWILEGRAASASKNSGNFEGSRAGVSLVLWFPSSFRIVSRSFLIHNLWKSSSFCLLLFHIKNSSWRERPRIFPGCFDPESSLENSFPLLPSLSQFPELGTILGSFQSFPVEFPAESNLGFLMHFPGIPGNSQPFPVSLGCIPPPLGFIFPRFGKRHSQNLLPAPAGGSSPIWNSQLILGSALEHSPNPRGALG